MTDKFLHSQGHRPCCDRDWKGFEMNDIINKLRHGTGIPCRTGEALQWMFDLAAEAADLLDQLQDENTNLKRQLDCLKDNKEQIMSDNHEWKELKTLQDVAAAHAAGEEIECNGYADRWDPWIDEYWHTAWEFRSRPAKSKMKKVKLYAWFSGGELHWLTDDSEVPQYWVRVPAEDKEIEVQK